MESVLQPDTEASVCATRFETDEEDTTSLASSLESDSEAPHDDDDDDGELHPAHAWELAVRHHRRARRGPLARPARRHTRQQRADDEFVATVRLRNEIEALRRQRDELMALHRARQLHSSRRDLALNTTIEYYDTFRDGFSGPRVPEMIRFFHTRLDTDVFAYGGSGFGLDMWIEQWRRYTHMFPSIGIELRSMEMTNLVESAEELDAAEADRTMSTSIIVARGMLTGRITRRAVCTVCPHLRGREALLQKLVDKALLCPLEFRFYFNSTGRIVRSDVDADFFTAFSSVEDVSLIELAEIMEHVAIGDNSTVPVPVEIDEGETAA